MSGVLVIRSGGGTIKGSSGGHPGGITFERNRTQSITEPADTGESRTVECPAPLFNQSLTIACVHPTSNYTYSYGSNVCLVVQDGGFNSQQALAAGAASSY